MSELNNFENSLGGKMVYDISKSKDVLRFQSDAETNKEFKSSLDQALDNCATYLTFIRMKGLLDDFSNFQDSLEYFERTKKLFKEKVSDV